MRKPLIAAIVLLSFCAIVALALLNLNSLINRNKDYLLQQAQQALGREVTVGEVGVTLWNGIGLRLNRFALSDDASFSSGDFLRAGDLQVNVKLLPLLRKELRIKRLILHDPVIEIIRNKGGQFNFSSIGRREAEDEKGQTSPEPGPEPVEAKGAPALLVSLIDISGGEVHYVDRKEGIDLRIKAIDFRVKDLDLEQPFSVDLAAALFSDKRNFKARTRLGPLRSLDDLSEIPLESKISVDSMDLDKLKSAVPGIKAALPRELNLSGIWRAKDVQLKGTLKNLALTGTLEGTDAAVSFGGIFKKSSGIPFVFSTDAHYAGDTVSFRRANVKVHALEVAAKGELRLGEAATVNLSLDSNQVSLAGWEKLVPLIQDYQLSGNLEVHATLRGSIGRGKTPRIQGTLTLSGVSARPPRFPKAVKDLNAKISFTGQRADLKETTLGLGKSLIRLAAEIDRFSPLTVSYRLSTPGIWPAELQPSLPDERMSDVIKNLSSEGTLVVKNGNLAFQGNLASSEGALYRIPYRQLSAGVVLADRVARLRNLRVNALNGSLQADGEYAFNSPVARFSLASKAQGLDLSELYRSLDPKVSRDIQGRLSADLKLSGSGKKWEEIKPNLRGQGRAEVFQGALLNFNVAEGVLSGVTGIPGLTSLINPQVRKRYPEIFEARDTEFKELKGLFTLADARMNVEDLRITAADYTVEGKGWVDYDRRVHFQSLLVLSQRVSADLARSVREVAYAFNNQSQFEIPFTLSGTLPRVRPKPDSGYLARMIQRGLVRKGTEELQRRLFGTEPSTPSGESPPSDKKRTPAEELIRRGLEGLFGR